MQKKNKRSRLFFFIVFIGILLVYLLACLIPFLDPAKFWFIAILGLGFPFLLALVLICLIISALVRSRWFFLALVVLLAGWQQIAALVSFHKQGLTEPKQAGTLRVLSWNVSSWTENYRDPNSVDRTGLRNLMIDAVQMQDADVLCFQEYLESYDPQLFPANMPVFRKMGFAYHYFTPTAKIFEDNVQIGLCIFSKYPILDSQFQKVGAGNSEGMSFADIQFNNQRIRIFNTHLESPRIAKQEYNPIGEVQESRTVLGKIKRAYSLRSQQAEVLRNCIDTSRYPVILCGDFNDVPNSYTYFKAKGNLQDAFVRKGSGIGRTFQFISPTLRIDYLMADKRFKIEQFAKLDYRYSDHFPQVMDVSLEK
jgi:endonuclease/exonuclease/phosphatase family metal-dependent hydrolase